VGNSSETGIIISGNVNFGNGPTRAGYHVGIYQDPAGAGTDQVYNSSVGQTFNLGAAPAASTAPQTTFTQDLNASAIATVSYTDAAGASLSGTDLTTHSNAQTAPGLLNLAIGDAPPRTATSERRSTP